MPDIAAGRTLSTLSTRNLFLHLKELLEAKTHLDWGTRMEKNRRERNVTERDQAAEAVMKEICELQEERAATSIAVVRALLDDTRTCWEGCPGLGVPGYTNGPEKSCSAGQKRRPKALSLRDERPEKNFG